MSLLLCRQTKIAPDLEPPSTAHLRMINCPLLTVPFVVGNLWLHCRAAPPPVPSFPYTIRNAKPINKLAFVAWEVFLASPRQLPQGRLQLARLQSCKSFVYVTSYAIA